MHSEFILIYLGMNERKSGENALKSFEVSIQKAKLSTVRNCGDKSDICTRLEDHQNS